MDNNKKMSIKNKKRVLATQAEELPATLDITKNAPQHQKYAIERAVILAQKSTASMGKFDTLHSDEPKIKNKPTFIVNAEHETTTKIADRVLKKASGKALDVDKAVRNEMRSEQFKRKKRNSLESSEKSKGKGKGNPNKKRRKSK